MLADIPDKTLAVAVMQEDALVEEWYAPDVGADTTLISWSMAKSVTHALVGILVRAGKLSIHSDHLLDAWRSDERASITLDHLLRMSSGLRWLEDYVDETISDVIEMLFGSGQGDMAAFAAAFPLDHPPDTVWNYSSGTSNIVASLVGRACGGDVTSFVRQSLFEPLGMTSATIRVDGAGTFVGSSYVYATARDFLRFGGLYLRDSPGLLPDGWIDYARTPTPASAGEYGAHWWLAPHGFRAVGYEGQYLYIVPEADLMVLRLGKSPAEERPDLEAWIDALIESRL
ncbi:MAG TPA: serine hydrolase [Nocardioides sp.]|nr:serine hydrolase [Nocardioides sp.]